MNPSTHCQPRATQSRLRPSAALVLFGIALVLSLLGSGQAQGACSENGSLFWRSTTYATAVGTQQEIYTRAHANGGCGQADNVRAGATAHVSLTCCSGLIEVGYRDLTNSVGTHYFRAFTEYCFSGSCTVALYTVSCITDGNWITYRVDQVGNRVWRFHYVCPGGSFTQLGSDTPQLAAGSGSPRVETFRFGPSGGGGFINDQHRTLYVHQSSGWILGFGTMACSLGMTDTRGQQNQPAGTSWSTYSASGYFCP